MGIFSTFYNTLLYKPVINLLIGLYELIPGGNIAYSIIVITILVRVVLWPLNQKAQEARIAMQKIQPELKKLQKKYEKNKEKLYQETSALYRKHNANPFSGCLPMLIQLPLMIAMYAAFRNTLNPDKIAEVNDLLYGFIPHVSHINTLFLWLDLRSKDPYYIIPIMVSGLQYLQTKTMMGKQKVDKKDSSAQAQQAMGKWMPFIYLLITINLPSGLILYILISSLIAIAQQVGLKEFFRFSFLKNE